MNTRIELIVFIMVLMRVSAFVAFFPLFSRRQLPVLVKVGMAVGLSFFWYGTIDYRLALPDGIELDFGLIPSLFLMIKEVTIGLMLALCLGLFFLPAKIAGAYIGQELGLSLASISDPGTQDSSTLVTRIFETFATMLFFATNLHHFLILVIHASFEQLLGKINLLELPTELIVTMFNSVTDYGFMIVAPVAVLLMLITLGLSFLNKAAPSLNLFSVGLSIRTGFGILCVLMFLPVIMGAMQTYLFRLQEDIEQLLNSF